MQFINDNGEVIASRQLLIQFGYSPNTLLFNKAYRLLLELVRIQLPQIKALSLITQIYPLNSEDNKR